MTLPRRNAFIAVLIIIIQVCVLVVQIKPNLISFAYVNTVEDIPNLNGTQEWTFMIYLDGDNNLEGDFIRLFNSLEEAIDPTLVNVIVLFDRNGGYDTSNSNWTETRLYQILPDSRNNRINSQLLENWGEMRLDKQDTLSRFIEYCLANYTAERYILDICDHGAGILGLCSDETSGTNQRLWVNEAQYAIQKAILGYIDKFDIIHFQACNMAMLELVYEFKDLADYLVVSEEASYTPKNLFRRILKELVSNPSISSLDFAISIAKNYEKIMHSSLNRILYDTTFSVIDTQVLNGVLQKFNYFVSNLTTVVEDGNHQEVFRIRFQTQDFYYHCFADLIHLLENILDSNLFNNYYQDLIISANSLLVEIEKLVVYNYQDIDFSQNANGLSLFLPYPDYNKWSSNIEQYKNHNNCFSSLDWLFDTDYEDIIHKLYKDDSDNDELYDWFERFYGLNPFYNDSDFNNVLDYFEDLDQDGNWNFIEQMDGSNPLLSDTDNDGISDREESGIYRPNNPGANENGYITTCPYDSDSDQDRWDDYREIFIFNKDPNDYKSHPKIFIWSIIIPTVGLIIVILIASSIDNEKKKKRKQSKKQIYKVDEF